jgi:hypothetical protein
VQDSEQEARIALLQYYGSLMQGYKVHILTISIASLAVIEIFLRVSKYYHTVALGIFISILWGLIIGGGFFCFARHVYIGKLVEFVMYSFLPGYPAEDSRISRLDRKIKKDFGDAANGKGQTGMNRASRGVARLGRDQLELFWSCVIIAAISFLVIYVLTSILHFWN